MLSTTISVLVAFFVGHASSVPYPLSNLTLLSNNTICNSSATLCSDNHTTIAPPPISTGEYVCHEVYPSDLTILNSRYPDYDADHLHQARNFFMLRRQLKDDGEVATRVQFVGLPPSTSNYSCRLEFVLPSTDLQHIAGPNPSFHVYQVEREAGAIATWNTFEGDQKQPLLYGTVNGEKQALEKTRSAGGVAAVNETACSETMTFQMAMMYDSEYAPNYWTFSNVAPPAWPQQGFRMVYGC
jgi:hypothetical protein